MESEVESVEELELEDVEPEEDTLTLVNPVNKDGEKYSRRVSKGLMGNPGRVLALDKWR